VCTTPAALIVLTGDPARGLAWAVGILPAAIIGLAPQRRSRARARLVSVGLLFALSIMLGSLLIQTSVTAVVGIFAVAFGSAMLASRRAFGLVVHTDHVGWAPAAALFVMRPTEDMHELRSVGRVVSVLLGALAAVALLRLTPSSELVAVLAVAAIGGAAGTRGSRWYVTPFFTTCLVLVMQLYADPTVANEQWRFAARVGETVLGVGLAYVFGLLVPRLLRRRNA
jgi:hypothetical protein